MVEDVKMSFDGYLTFGVTSVMSCVSLDRIDYAMRVILQFG